MTLHLRATWGSLVVWRIGERSRAPLRCVALRNLPDGTMQVRSSTFSRNILTVNAADVFADRDACRAEIQRRAAMRETPNGASPACYLEDGTDYIAQPKGRTS